MKVTAEAEAAAEAVGGLGRQLWALDDALLEPLRQFGAERLAGVRQQTAVDALYAIFKDAAELRQWWHELWETATPLWRYDEAQLPETARAYSVELAGVCGAGVPMLSETSDATLSPESAAMTEVAHPASLRTRWMESNDRKRITLLRLRSGLTAAAMVRAKDER
jgi:hypothetical protein